MKVRFHSDCDYFAGCENMLANFFADEDLAREAELSFSYRPSKEYEEGLRGRVPNPPRLVPLDVIDFHQVTGLANDWPAPLRVLFKSLTRLLLVKYWVWLWDVWRLRRSLAGEGIDILHVNNGGFPGALSCMAAGPAARLAGVKRVVHVNNNAPVPYNGPDRWLDWPLDRAAVRSTSVWVVASDHLKKEFGRFLGVAEDGVAAVPNGIAARETTETPAEVRKRLGAGSRPLLAVVAVLEPRKGHRVLFEALAKLRSEGLALPLTVLGGDGTIRGELEALSRELGLEKDVVFLGWVSKHFDLFNAADIVALPSIAFEDYPNVIIEAMGLGKPVVATKLGGIGEQLEDGVSGLVVKPGDAAALARALGSLLREPALRERLGKAAKARFDKIYTAKASVARYIKLYKSLLQEAA